MGWNADWRHELWLNVEPTSVGEARRFVGDHLVAHDLRHLVETVRLVASELATNAVVHSRTPFTVSLSASEGTVMLAVEDGSAARPRSHHTAAHVLNSGGRGMLIVEMLSDRWGVSEEDGQHTDQHWEWSREASEGHGITVGVSSGAGATTTRSHPAYEWPHRRLPEAARGAACGPRARSSMRCAQQARETGRSLTRCAATAPRS